MFYTACSQDILESNTALYLRRLPAASCTHYSVQSRTKYPANKTKKQALYCKKFVVFQLCVRNSVRTLM